jgi:LysR family hydrogen peroxide-inducible transcriptional activator
VREFVRPVVGRRIGIAWRAGSPREADARKVGEVIKEQLTATGV